MVFLLEYDRKRGALKMLRPFRDSERSLAEKARLDLELSLNKRGVGHEVVLLEARDEAALRKTHRRYFEDLAGLSKAAA